MDKKYMELVARFPLLPITNKSDLASAQAMILELTRRDEELSYSEIGYGKVLAQLIQVFERTLVGDFFKNVSGESALEYLLNEHQLKQTEAARIAGVSKQNLNDFLNGRRGLTKAARLRLAAYFKVGPEVFEIVEQQITSA